jgi:hypothetical protein
MPNPAYTINPVYARRARKAHCGAQISTNGSGHCIVKEEERIGVTSVREQEALKRASQDLLIRRTPSLIKQAEQLQMLVINVPPGGLPHLIGDSKTCEAIFCA